MTSPILHVTDLSIRFQTEENTSYAVNHLDFDLYAGETLGIVGESGSGKSVSCSSLMGLLPSPPAIIAPKSRAMMGGRNLLQLSTKELNKIRGREISMIFQDPMTSLNPYMRVGDQVAEPLVIHHHLSWKEARERAIEELDKTGIPNAAQRARCYPHEFSGGMRQRVMIAMALITRPKILIADEPTTALDVSVQKQVLDLLRARQQEHGTAIILITHDLGLVKHYSDRILVMYAGSMVEAAPTAELLASPLHAYTRSLIAANPAYARKGDLLPTIPGMAPSLNSAPSSCSFSPRNVIGRAELCLQDRVPELIEHSPQHWVRNCPGCLS